jgi:hypothetical protein
VEPNLKKVFEIKPPLSLKMKGSDVLPLQEEYRVVLALVYKISSKEN